MKKDKIKLITKHFIKLCADYDKTIEESIVTHFNAGRSRNSEIRIFENSVSFQAVFTALTEFCKETKIKLTEVVNIDKINEQFPNLFSYLDENCLGGLTLDKNLVAKTKLEFQNLWAVGNE